MNLQRLERDFNAVNEFGKTSSGMNRLAYSAEERKAVEYIKDLCIKEGMQVRTDAFGNLIARREGKDETLPAVACGSHLDTVYDGGAYDGTIGVLAGLEAVRSLNEKNISTLHPIELIVFACEESSRFSMATVGSKAMAGVLKVESIKNLVDKNGVTIEQAFLDNNLNIKSIDSCKRTKEELKAFLELHIEQGPILEQENLQIGVVTGIAAPTRLKIKINGVASHSGSTMMQKRKDALLGAAEMALIVEKLAKKENHDGFEGTVATVGTLVIKPGAMNVVPGYAEMQVDIRGIHKESIKRVFDQLVLEINEVQERRSLSITWDLLSKEDPALTDEEIQKTIISKCEKLGLSYNTMQSGAGHDAMYLSKICPTGMIFVPSKDGLSHNPKEFTNMEDVFNGANVLMETLLELAVPVK